MVKIGNSPWTLEEVLQGEEGQCDHCGRNLKNRYVVRNEDTRETLTLGSVHCEQITGWGLSLTRARRLLGSVESRGTKAVIDNLCREHPEHYMSDVWEYLDYGSVPYFQASASRWLRDRSNLRGRTIDGADWDRVYKIFKARKDAD